VPLGSLTRPELIFPDLPAADRQEVLRALAGRVAAGGLVKSADALFQQLWDREQLGSTGIGGGIAIPHCKLAGLKHGVVAVGIVPQGVDFGAVDGLPVRVFFLVVSPDGAPGQHLQTLAAISRWVKTGGHTEERLLALHDPRQVYDLLCEGD
jgi:PTS system nitrogen regulatory IIA component